MLLTGLVLAETEQDVQRELQGYETKLNALGSQVPAAEAVSARLKQAQNWRKGVLAVQSEARNLSPMVRDAVKLASFAFIELRAARGVGNKPVALRVLVGANEKEALVQSKFPYLVAQQTPDGMWLAGVAPIAPGASLEPWQAQAPKSKLDRLKREREQAKGKLQAVTDLKKNQVALDKLRKDNAALAKKIGWKTLGPEKPEQVAKSVQKSLPKSLSPGLELLKTTVGKTEKMTLARDVYWTGTRIELELSGTPPELAQQLASWESFGLDRPVLLESVQMDLQGAKVRLIAFARQPY